MTFDFNKSDVGITRPFSERTHRRIGTTLLVLACFCFLWTCYSSVKKWQFIETAIITTGTVDTLNPVAISFETATGTPIRFNQGSRSKKSPSHVGEKVQIAYSPNMPTQAEMVEHLWMRQWAGGFVSMFLLLFGYALRKGYAEVGPLRQNRIRIGF